MYRSPNQGQSRTPDLPPVTAFSPTPHPVLSPQIQPNIQNEVNSCEASNNTLLIDPWQCRVACSHFNRARGGIGRHGGLKIRFP